MSPVNSPPASRNRLTNGKGRGKIWKNTEQNAHPPEVPRMEIIAGMIAALLVLISLGLAGHSVAVDDEPPQTHSTSADLPEHDE